MTSDLTVVGTTSPTVSTELIIHLPEEIVDAARHAERDGGRIVVCCRTAEQAGMLAEKLLIAELGSAVLTGQASRSDVNDTVDAFNLGDFTVLLVTDDLYNPWQVDSDVRLIHADLPAPYGAVQLMTAINTRRARIRATVAA